MYSVGGRPWPNRHSSCTANIYKLDAFAGARGFDPELHQYASRVPNVPTIKTWQVEKSPLLSGINNKPIQQLKKKVFSRIILYHRRIHIIL